MKTFATMIAGALTFVLQGAFAGAQAVNAAGHCTGMTVTDFLSSDADDVTTATTFVNLTDGHLNFTTSSAGCVIITFFGEGATYQNPGFLEALEVRTLLDGNNLCAPALTGDVFVASGQPGWGSANSIMRICKNVTAGSHTVQVQYHSANGGQVQILGHQLVITHN